MPVFAEEEYYGNVKADSFYEEESDNAIIFEYPSYIGYMKQRIFQITFHIVLTLHRCASNKEF